MIEPGEYPGLKELGLDNRPLSPILYYCFVLRVVVTLLSNDLENGVGISLRPRPGRLSVSLTGKCCLGSE